MAGSWLLLAGIEDIAWVLIALASFAVWVYNQIKKANEEEAKKSAPPPPQESPPQRPRTRQAQTAAPPVRTQSRSSKPRTIAPTQDEWEKSEDVASHVRKHLDTQEFEQRTGSLGQLAQLDDTVDEHVEQAFGHEVGTFRDQGVSTEGDQVVESTEAALATTAAAAGIAEVLADPASLRNAIILQEILRPPSWE
jgi:hypothetical protein